MEHGKENPPQYSQNPPQYPQYPQAPAQYPQQPQSHTYPPNYSLPTVVQVGAQPQVIIVGGCPKCRVGVLEDQFTCGGWCCCFWLFPIGLICLYSMREKRCINCNERF